MTADSAHPVALRRKIESWLGEADTQQAMALRARSEARDDSVMTIGGTAVRIVACPTVLAARAALTERREGERLVLLTELSDSELGDGILAHVSRCTVRSINPWDLVGQMFGLKSLDLTVTDKNYGGGRWIAEALTEHVPEQGWPPPPGTILTRDHALRCLAGQVLGIDRDQLDSAGLLQWSTNPEAVREFSQLPTGQRDGITAFLTDIAGSATVAIMAAVRAGHGAYAIPLGILTAALWPAGDVSVSTELVAARIRLEPFLDGLRLTDAQARSFATAAEAWVDRALDVGERELVHRLFRRAEAIATQIDAKSLLAGSDVLPGGFAQRLRTLAEAVRTAIPAALRLTDGDGGPEDTAALTVAQHALTHLERHRAADPARLEAARMAVRLLRWLAQPDGEAPGNLLEAMHRQVRDDGWVDRARLDVFAGDPDPQVAEAYGHLHRAVDDRRGTHDLQFATALAADTAEDAPPGALIRVEDFLTRVVRPILDHRQVLLVVIDGMSIAAATELAESLTRNGPWVELTPVGGPRTGVLAALPTVTEVSRCSLFSGQVTVGRQKEEQEAFSTHFPAGKLLHKAALRASAGAALDPEVIAILGDSSVPIVAAVVNTIDDALDRSDPGTVVWGEDNIRAVRDLLYHAQNRVVVFVSDHGHIVDRGPEAVTMPSAAGGNRWREATSPAVDGEILVTGPRVALGGGRVVLPWREQLRYGPRKAGYHGGAAAAEVVIPLLVFTVGDDQDIPGWAGAPIASPAWWREPIPDLAALPLASRPGSSATKRRTKKPTQDDVLFSLTAGIIQPPAPSSPSSTAPESVRPTLIEALLASEMYRQRQNPRTPLPDDRVAAMLETLLAGGGRATIDTLAVRAAVPAHRINGTITALRKLLQVEGYPVLDIDPDGRTVILDRVLLVEQFHLELP